ncbi:hypothetical protein [Synechococcus sp. MIT S9451]|uniref:hypothetical protein n=1 Tax=Synechococcus sp. MIT S9451 TaxID=3082543 RepID=UPI0039B54151
MTRSGLWALPRPLLLALGGLTALVLVQQQVLLRRPPRLQMLAIQPLRSGAGALDVRFSRPMQRETIAAESRIKPELSHAWFGADNAWRLLLNRTDPIQSPLQLDLAGADRRGLRVAPSRWFWDPRPTLLAVVQLKEGQQLQLQDRQGSWVPLSPVLPGIFQVEPFGDGRGVAFVSADDNGDQFVDVRHLTPRSLATDADAVGSPLLGDLERITQQPQLFAHVSSNLRGDLLVQAGRLEPGSDQLWMRSPDGRRRDLSLKVAGPIRLLPDGTGLVVPGYDGLELLSLQTLQDQASERQTLPGSRDLRAFCTGSGRALLVRHWPDYRRSVELVIPGLPPRQIWLGEQAVMGVACDNGGERLWVVLRDSLPKAVDTLLLLDRDGKVRKQRRLEPWLMAPDSWLRFDPVSDQLLLSVISSRRAPGRIAWVDGSTLGLRIQAEPSVVSATLLPAAGRIDRF